MVFVTCPGSSGNKVGTHTIHDVLPSQGTLIPTYTQIGTMKIYQLTENAHLWNVGRSWSTGGGGGVKKTHRWG